MARREGEGIAPLNVRISGTGSYVPERILTNDDLANMVETSNEWITQRTGIKQRRIASDNVVPSDLGAKASLQALKNATVKPEDVEFIVCATSFPDRMFPSTACYIQKKTGCVNAGAVDVLAGCTGFIYALSIGSQFVANGTFNNVLVIGAEILSRITNYKDRSTCVLLGDGAGAALLQRTDSDSNILYVELGADGWQGEHITLPAGGAAIPGYLDHVDKSLFYLHMKGRETYKFAVNKMVELTEHALKKYNLVINDVSLVVPHQMNLRIIESAAERLGLPMEKIFINIDKYGNTSSASVPVAFDEALSCHRVKRGDIVLMMAFGAGLTWGSVLLRY